MRKVQNDSSVISSTDVGYVTHVALNLASLQGLRCKPDAGQVTLLEYHLPLTRGLV
jgi:NaMN:DMB phosphoribosyltransferase